MKVNEEEYMECLDLKQEQIPSRVVLNALLVTGDDKKATRFATIRLWLLLWSGKKAIKFWK